MTMPFLILLVLFASPVWSALPTCCLTDSPECGCFTDLVTWTPAGTWIQDVAIDTLGTNESCRSNGGKPYYQMRLGYNDRAAAQAFACNAEYINAEIGAILVPELMPEAWCSEAVSYWHREARIPYDTGYRNNTWYLHWRAENGSALKSYYKAEEDSGGRGRWVHWDEIDYDDFHPGENAPVPGAYVLIGRLDTNTNKWDGKKHSLMINEMTIHEDVNGKVLRVEISLLEGNRGDAVTASRVWSDILDLTPAGNTFIDSSNRKIRGFGIDLGSDGKPLYDPNRLHRVTSASRRIHIDRLPEIHDPMWEKHYEPLVKKLIEYAKISAKRIIVSTSNSKLGLKGVPNGVNTVWKLSPDHAKQLGKDVEITLDLLAEHPLPILGVEFSWHKVPKGRYRVQWAGEDKRFHDAKLLMPGELPGKRKAKIANVPEAVARLSKSGESVRYLRLSIAPDAFQDEAVLADLRFQYDWGPDRDAEYNPCEEAIDHK